MNEQRDFATRPRDLLEIRNVVVDVAGAAAADAGLPDDEPGAAWSRRWKSGIERGLQVPEIPSPDRVTVSIGKLEDATKEGTIRANTMRLLIDHGTKESRVPGSNDFKQPDDWRKPVLISATSRRRIDQPGGRLQVRAKALPLVRLS